MSACVCRCIHVTHRVSQLSPSEMLPPHLGWVLPSAWSSPIMLEIPRDPSIFISPNQIQNKQQQQQQQILSSTVPAPFCIKPVVSSSSPFSWQNLLLSNVLGSYYSNGTVMLNYFRILYVVLN